MKKRKKCKKPEYVHFGQRLRKLRHTAGISQEQAAEKISRSPRTIQRYEAGDTMPDVPTLRKILDCYQCEVSDLFPLLYSSAKESGGVL